MCHQAVVDFRLLKFDAKPGLAPVSPVARHPNFVLAGVNTDVAAAIRHEATKVCLGSPGCTADNDCPDARMLLARPMSAISATVSSHEGGWDAMWQNTFQGTLTHEALNPICMWVNESDPRATQAFSDCVTIALDAITRQLQEYSIEQSRTVIPVNLIGFRFGASFSFCNRYRAGGRLERSIGGNDTVIVAFSLLASSVLTGLNRDCNVERICRAAANQCGAQVTSQAEGLDGNLPHAVCQAIRVEDPAGDAQFVDVTKPSDLRKVRTLLAARWCMMDNGNVPDTAKCRMELLETYNIAWDQVCRLSPPSLSSA